MHKIWIFSFLILSIFASDRKFCVAIHSCNNAKWVEKNLHSVFSQRYHDFRVIYVSDGSTDGTDEIVREYVKSQNNEARFTLITNRERQGPLACMCQIAHMCDFDEILVDLDGNDWLANTGVLKYLNQIYQDETVWMTYGQFIRFPGYGKGFAKEVDLQVIENNRFRSEGGSVTHLKTFYASLFQQIDKKCFFYDGNFIQRAGDLAYTLPILEMAGTHSRFIPEALYVYNQNLPFHPDKEPSQLEEQMDRYIRSLQPYAPLANLPTPQTLPIYSQIENLKNLTLSDYQFIQDFLKLGKRDKLGLLKDMEWRARNIKIIGENVQEFPKSGLVLVNSTLAEKENCILIYSSFNDRYPQGLLRLLHSIENSDYKGHVLYRIGGWPNVDGGGIVLSHVPYGFKIAFFQEAERLGYKKVLYLDSAIVPIASLNTIFDSIASKGYFVMGNSHMVGPYINSTAASFFGLNHAAAYQIPSCSAGIFGLDLRNQRIKIALDWWFKSAIDSDAFYSARSDQNALSIILDKLGMKELTPLDRMPHSTQEIREDSLFLLDRSYVH